MFWQLDQLEVAANERSSSRWMAVERRARLVNKPSENPQCPADAKRLADDLMTAIDSVTVTALVATSGQKGVASVVAPEKIREGRSAHRFWIF